MLISILMFASAPTTANVVVSTMTTPILVDVCKGDIADRSLDECSAYILGVFDSASLSREVCAPHSAATSLQVMAIGRKAIRDYPAQWSKHPSVIIRDALMAAFPCKP